MVLVVAVTFGPALPVGRADDAPKRTKVRKLSPKAVFERLDAGETAVFLDTRGGGLEDRIDGAIFVHPTQVEQWAERVDRDRFVVAYCSCPNEESSGRLVRALQRVGFTNAFALDGGLAAWKREIERRERARRP